MSKATFCFYAELNDFLKPGQQRVSFDQTFEGTPSAKHLIEALGVPHTEVARLTANGKRVDLGYLAQDGDRFEIYPISAVSGVEVGELLNQPEGEPRFILDNHLGRLAVYLRMLGFDALYRNDYQDEELAQIAGQETRILLTRDRQLLMRSLVTYGYWVRVLNPSEQLHEVVRRFGLARAASPFCRCMRCNGLLKPVAKEAILHRLEPLTRRYFDEFRICAECKQVYWKGSHWQRMQKLIGEVLRQRGDVERATD